MANILRVKARWSGFTGAPGYSIFHFRDFTSEGFTPDEAAGAAARVRAFFSAASPYLPNTVGVTVEGEAEVIDIDSGEMVDVVAAGTHAIVNGSAGPGIGYAAPVGAVVSWRTNTVRNGRRMRGRTFLVPLSVAAYEQNGTLVAGAVTALNTAATGLRDNSIGLDLCIYGRPPKLVGAGTYGPVIGHTVPDMAAVLSSRRD